MDWDVLGHEWAARLLQQHIARQEVRHAYLFTGPPGVGRRTLALRFAQAINCLQPPAPGEPCGVCRVCAQTARMQQPDLSVVQAETVGGMLKIEQVRELQHSLSLAPYEARYRVALLLRFHEANANAQNALLKTLEEAPDRVILLLTADTPESLLPTILSRCEPLRLRPLPLERMDQALQTRWGIPAEEAQLLAHLSGGRLGYALHLHQNPRVLEARRAWVEDLRGLLTSSRRARFAFAEKVCRPRDKSKAKDDLRLMYQVWLSYWRDLLICAAGAATPLTNLDCAQELRDLAGQVGLEQARCCTTSVQRALARLDANLNPQLLTEVLLLDFPYL